MEGDNTEQTPDYTYLITNFENLPPYQTQEGFEVTNFELKAFVNVDSKREADEWLLLHCIYSNQVKKKQGNREVKRPNSSRAQNIGCTATIYLRLELCEEFLKLFNDSHSSSLALHVYKDNLHLNASDEQELLETLADRAKNPAELVQDYNDKGQGKAVLQEYDTHAGKAFILCIITSLMCRVHEKVLQAGELCYVNALASFDSLNSSIILLYTSCTVRALPLGLFVTSDELEITLKKAMNLLKTVLPPYAFFRRGPQIGLMVFLTNDSSAERNALELCWPKGIHLLCTFHFLQAFWRWLYDSKHKVNKEDQVPIMEKARKILYALSGSEMKIHYEEFKQKFYNHPQLRSHFELLWKHRQFWALSFHLNLPMCGNNTNNYIERSFGIMKDIIFASTKAYNPIQIFQFIIITMERFFERRVLKIAHKHVGHLRIAKRFLYPNWETINMDAIQKTCVDNEFLVLSIKDANTFYIVNSEIGVCSCPVGMTGTPCKHQGAVSMKYHLSNFNFILSLTLNDRITYAYIALALRTALNKFKDRYNAAKSKSILQLFSLLYDLNHDLDPIVHIKSSAHIRVQVESIKRRKMEGGSSKQRLPVLINKDKENLDPHAIPVRKKRKTAKKEHNLCKNILSNRPN
ncbi:10514_t:CDS:2 [Funneliformis caledonium]|uniref:10514_t:CDS:1 n=1 Tax=Funneliformis caledonium TaxID=1117310 RepID=A0A9N9E4C7_9GLOM|nr:10514_t:CDS:2 [Funneliformis caledonium]